jgi:hypothetical protein
VPPRAAAAGVTGGGGNVVLVETAVLADMRERAQEAALRASAAAAADAADGAAPASATPTSLLTTGLPYEVATVQVRIDDRGARSGGGGAPLPGGATPTLIVKLRYDNTVADLRRAIDAHLGLGEGGGGSGGGGGGGVGDAGELRPAVPPPRASADGAATLRAAGLTPNATVFLRRVA